MYHVQTNNPISKWSITEKQTEEHNKQKKALWIYPAETMGVKRKVGRSSEENKREFTRPTHQLRDAMHQPPCLQQTKASRQAKFKNYE